MSINDYIPFDFFTTEGGGFALAGEAVRKSTATYDFYGNKDTLKGYIINIVVSEVTAEKLASYTGTSVDLSKTDLGEIMIYAVRLSCENSPHAFLPEPCDVLTVDFDGYSVAKALTREHTFMLGPTGLEIGAEVLIKLDKTQAGSYNLRFGTFVETYGKDISKMGGDAEECISTMDLFNSPDIDGARTIGSLPKRSWGLNQPLSPREFFNKLKNNAFFDGFSDNFLWGLTANALAESGLTSNAAGDPESVIGKREFTPVKKFCSFGYWQLNLCSKNGEGANLLKSVGQTLTRDLYDTDTEEMYFNFIVNENQQFSWVSKRMKELFPNDWNNNSISAEEAGRKITEDFERPINRKQKGKTRGKTAQALADQAAAGTV
tara:strand:- start:905 stop:2032 length:1128 start_codon:yes stop_codon:yes gene_type:complete